MKTLKPLSKWSFIFDQTKSRLLYIILLGILLLVMILEVRGVWWDVAEPYITILILAVALLVWYQQMTEEWEEDYLPKSFSGQFFFKGNEVMRFENAMLTTEGDIRALAQQIGQQMAKEQFLKFVAPEVEVTAPKLNKKDRHIHHSISIKLTELPNELSIDKIRIWKAPFMNINGKPNFKDEERK